MIIFFSGTGNSRYCASMLSDLLDDELFDAFAPMRAGKGEKLHSDKPLVFVSPTYSWRIPRVFSEFLEKSEFDGCGSAYFVMTCGNGIGNAGEHNGKICTAKGLKYMGTAPIIMPENFIAMFDAPPAEKAKQIVAAAREHIRAAAKGIKANECFAARRAGAFGKLESGVINTLFYKFSTSAAPFTVKDSCNGCKKCENGCVMGNIKLKEGRPVFGESCTQCMACICGCPVLSIEYGKKSRGKPRYQCVEYRKED